MRPPWDVLGPVSAWELYDLSKDWTQFENVADKYPEKLKELQDLFWAEAEKYQVLPLDASVATRFLAPRPSLTAGRTSFTWSGELTGTPNGDAPFILDPKSGGQHGVNIDGLAVRGDRLFLGFRGC